MITFDWQCHFCSNAAVTYDGFTPQGWEFVLDDAQENSLNWALVVCCEDCYDKRGEKIVDGKA